MIVKMYVNSQNKQVEGQLMVNIRLATKMDTQGIENVKQSAWLDEQTNEDYIDDVIDDSNHVILVAQETTRIIGFVDGFETFAQDGARRWEIDLLAVHPDHRGRGIAKLLVGECVSRGGQRGCSISRSLIRVDNDSSIKVFTACGYKPETEVYGLYVSSGSCNINIPIPDNLHLVTVNTMNYRGVWLEGELSGGTFAAAVSTKTRLGLDIAGAIIPLGREGVIEKALSAGYSLVGHYRFWIRYF